ncbi:hypothetical protein B296_00046961 [Ensete ventricosum]|uniref:Uncharacterized protein n=1 Tax=Ensete ventricosum TaxID=4639 RepID=A0A426XY47_ENSVE|nr:hypothetical protein B296_00046961 [Ensete ventricosum]
MAAQAGSDDRWGLEAKVPLQLRSLKESSSPAMDAASQLPPRLFIESNASWTISPSESSGEPNISAPNHANPTSSDRATANKRRNKKNPNFSQQWKGELKKRKDFKDLSPESDRTEHNWRILVDRGSRIEIQRARKRRSNYVLPLSQSLSSGTRESKREANNGNKGARNRSASLSPKHPPRTEWEINVSITMCYVPQTSKK